MRNNVIPEQTEAPSTQWLPRTRRGGWAASVRTVGFGTQKEDRLSSGSHTCGRILRPLLIFSADVVGLERYLVFFAFLYGMFLAVFVHSFYSFLNTVYMIRRMRRNIWYSRC